MDLPNQQRSVIRAHLSVRPMRRVDRSIVFANSFVRWNLVESDVVTTDLETSFDCEFIELVAEKNNQIVGWLRAARTSLRSDSAGIQASHALKHAWWMPPTDGWDHGAGLQLDPQGNILLGLGAGILAKITDSPTEHALVLSMMYEFGRSRLVRQLGLSRWIAQIPLTDPTAWLDVYSSAGYVQQVEHGAIEDPLLSQHLRKDVRVLEVSEDQKSVWIVWQNPVN